MNLRTMNVVWWRWCIFPHTVVAKCIINFRFYLYSFLRKKFQGWVGPCNLLRPRILWWLDTFVAYNQTPIARSRRSPSFWIPVDSISFLQRIIQVWDFILVLLVDELLYCWQGGLSLWLFCMFSIYFCLLLCIKKMSGSFFIWWLIFYVKAVDIFCIIRFDIINFLFNCFLRF